MRDRPADRATGVVDQDVDTAVVGQHFFDDSVTVVGFGKVGGMNEGSAPRRLDLRSDLGQLVFGSSDQHHRSTGRTQLERRRPTYSR